MDNVIVKQLDQYPDVMGIDHVAKYLTISNSKVYDLITSNELKACKIGKSWKISKQNLLDYMKNVGLM